MRIGIFLCECGPNISEVIDLNSLQSFAAALPGVVMVEKYPLYCSPDGQEKVVQGIRDNRLERVVFAGCSPREHEETFRRVLTRAGLNPYLLQIVNLREQCAWVASDPARTGVKARALLRAAVRRVEFHLPLEQKEIPAVPDVLVLGAGVAGLQTARLLAAKGRKVTLVEKQPSIGGKVVLFEEVFPGLECASCLLEPWMDEVLHRENLEVMTLSTLEEVKGSLGNFIVKIKKQPRFIDETKCLGCAACYDPCTVEVPNEYEGGKSRRKAVFVPYVGSLPNIPSIDRKNCLHFRGQECNLCREVCPFGAIDFSQKEEIVERRVGAIVLATGYSLWDCRKMPELGYGREDILTGFDLERLNSATGPTGGQIRCADGRAPGSVVFILCVGSRDPEHRSYCSKVCCLYSLKQIHSLLKKLPEATIHVVFRDWCLPGKSGQELRDGFNNEKRVVWHRLEGMKGIRVEGGNRQIKVAWPGPDRTGSVVPADLVILAPALEPPAGLPELARMLNLKLKPDGYMQEESEKLAPGATTLKGVYLAGCVQGPKDMQESAQQGAAAAGLIFSGLIPGERLRLEPASALVAEERCGGCRLCISLCPYRALSFSPEKGVTVVDEALCQGCGVCAATCPSGAAEARQFTSRQIAAELEELAGD
ncbi:MAG: CoB--CoM heterodisulfide reductase iron-sulfur subunit A family protein [bacterium]|nr:CoB--CoM heterodisulfide reductase iron-sulfur subunit A family protein [bacterium]